MAIRNYRAGGFVTDTPSDFINLYGAVASASNFTTFRKSGATAGYAVTTGKQFYICQMLFQYADESGSNVGIAIGYADNDLGVASVTARTNPVPLIGNPEGGGVPERGGLVWDGAPGGTAFPPSRGLDSGLIWKGAPAGKYMYMASNTSLAGLCSVLITGFEVDA